MPSLRKTPRLPFMETCASTPPIVLEAVRFTPNIVAEGVATIVPTVRPVRCRKFLGWLAVSLWWSHSLLAQSSAPQLVAINRSSAANICAPINVVFNYALSGTALVTSVTVNFTDGNGGVRNATTFDPPSGVITIPATADWPGNNVKYIVNYVLLKDTVGRSIYYNRNNTITVQNGTIPGPAVHMMIFSQLDFLVIPLPSFQLSAVSRASAATVAPQDNVSFNYATVGGTSRDVIISFTDPAGTVRTATVASSPLSGTASIAVGADWPKGAYQVNSISLYTPYYHSLHPTADPYAIYARDGSVSFDNGSDPFSALGTARGTSTHTFNLASLDFQVAGPVALPVITTQPSSQTVTASTTASFTVAATSSVAVTYQWLKNAAAIPGATSASYTYAPTTADDGSRFTCNVTNSAGTVTSTAAVLTVNPAVAPKVTTQPSSLTVALPASATFTLVASGSPSPTYQWYRNSAAISGATSASYTLPSTSTADSGASFTCVATNIAGSVTSAAAILTVASSPSIATQPFSQSVTAGSSATFSVTVASTTSVTYQWLRNSVAISGATSASFSIVATAMGDSGSSFTCSVTNSAGSVTSAAATLTVTAGTSAPAIFMQPGSQAVSAGATVVFSVVASGSAPLSYQWYRNTVAIPGATAASYTTATISSVDSGSVFTCTVTNSAGSATTAAAVLTVAAGPTITVQPASQTVTAGTSVTFTVAATSTSPISYQWSRNTVAIPGATSASYTLASPAMADSGSSFVCSVSTAAGAQNTLAATLTVNPAPIAPNITTPPVSQTITAGGTAVFSVVAGGDAPLSYQWLRNLVAIPGATSPSYTTSPMTTADSGSSFICTVTNAVGSVTSAAATLTVKTAPVAPSITTPPVSQTITAGGTVVFSVVAGGDAPLSYQWLRNLVAIPGATSPSYTTSPMTTADSGSSFICTVTNAVGSVTSAAATLTVKTAPVAPSITTPPVSQTITAGGTAVFSVVAGGNAPLSYQWLRNLVAIPGATSPSYTTSPMLTADSGSSFICTVTNAVGSVTSTAAILTVNAAPVAPSITSPPVPLTVTAGATAIFSVVAGGDAPLGYQWLKNSVAIAGATAASLTLPSVGATSAGKYSVVVTNSVGSVTSSEVGLTVLLLPVITAQPVGVTVNQGQNATFTVAASGAESYQWSKDGVSIPGASFAVLRLAAVSAAQAGSYAVTVGNSTGSTVSTAAVLAVKAPVIIATQPTPVKAALGERVVFSVQAEGDSGASVSYQWRRDGISLAGGTGAALTISSITAADYGAYSVLITSPSGTAVSEAAALSRLTDSPEAPVITQEPRGVTISPHGSLILSVVATGSPAPDFLWRLNGVPLPGASRATLVVTDVLPIQAGSYSVVVSNSAGSVTSAAVPVVVTDGFSRQLNLSTLGYVGVGGDIMISGFVVAGSNAKRLLVRATGPTLAAYGVTDRLADPWLAVFKEGVQWVSNDNWSTDFSGAQAVRAAGASVGAFALADGSNDAALVVSLDPGSYTIQVSGVAGTTGQALVEVYDLDPLDPAGSRLVNLATRALVRAGAGPLISGFVVQGAVARAVLVRAAGPALASYGVSGFLQRPKLSLFDNFGRELATNTGWEASGISDATISAAQSVGAFPLPRGSTDSVILTVLPPGNYTAQVFGSDGGSGVTLLEVYELP